LDPRKLPVQARSAASVDAILDATIQVLLKAPEPALVGQPKPELNHCSRLLESERPSIGNRSLLRQHGAEFPQGFTG
jgi:hypothetical protein